MIIRPEQPNDIPFIREVNVAAFESEREADLVDQLREQESQFISLVAESEGKVVGHILFTPVELRETGDGGEPLILAGLAPMAVLPDFQRRGVGKELIWNGLKWCRLKNVHAVVVLGHPDYYPKFGFRPSVEFGILSQFDVPDDVFMVLELKEGILKNRKGTIYYHPLFETV